MLLFYLSISLSILSQVSKHPALNEYINESLRTVRGLLRLQQLKCLSVCFYNEDEMPIERFVFDILDIQERYKISPSLYVSPCIISSQMLLLIYEALIFIYLFYSFR